MSLLLPTVVLAVEPISLGTVTTIISIIGSIASFLFTAIRFITTWSLLIVFLFLVLGQLIPFFNRLNLVRLLESALAEAALCNPAGPDSDKTDTRGNVGYRNRGES